MEIESSKHSPQLEKDMNRPSILLADDHNIITEAIKNLLEPEFEVIGTVADGRSLVSKAIALKPDVIVMDISMPLLNGLEAGRQLKTVLPNAKFLYLTAHQDWDVIAEAFQTGAIGFVVK